jgi:hypothetical protein
MLALTYSNPKNFQSTLDGSVEIETTDYVIIATWLG